MTRPFAGQAVWITGASSGIGAALARVVAMQGARLVLSGRNIAALEAVAQDCGDCLLLPFDTTDDSALGHAVERAWEWALEGSGGIDMLVNSAGISQRSLAVETDYTVYQRIIAVDLLAPIALTQAVLPHMAQRGSGRIVMISSIAGKVGVPMRTAYCAAKHGLIGYADALRAEIAHLGLAVHVVAPGSVRTDVSRNALTADGSARGESDPAIENGIDSTDAAERMLDAIVAGTREIIIAEAGEAALGEARRTPDALFDRIAALMSAGYAEKMKT